MKIKIVAVGKIKESYFTQAIDEYLKRCSRFCKMEVKEVPETLFKGTPNPSEIDNIITSEGKLLLDNCEGFVVAMDIDGKALGSCEIADVVKKAMQTNSTFTFVIGGSHGLSQEVKKRADIRWSLGAITLPHQLARVVTCEQIYRLLAINNNVGYHK